MNQTYVDTVRLLLAIAPTVFESQNFALKGGTALNLFVQDMPRLSVDIDSRSHGGEGLVAWLATLNTPHTFTAAGSSLKFCRIAAGEADVYPRFGSTSQWDTAAAQCVLVEAGGSVLDLMGAALQYGLDKPVLNPEFVDLGRPEMFATYFSSKAIVND